MITYTICSISVGHILLTVYTLDTYRKVPDLYHTVVMETSNNEVCSATNTLHQNVYGRTSNYEQDTSF